MRLHVATIVVALFVLFSVMAFQLWPESRFTPISGGGYDGLQVVVEDVVKGDGAIHILGVEKCNDASEPIGVTGSASWIRIDDGNVTYVTGWSGSGTRDSGCLTNDYENVLPGLGPGVWQVEGVECTYRGRQTQCKNWTTEPFKVVE